MKFCNRIALFSLLSFLILAMASCDGSRVKKAKEIVINEIMASNRTGLLKNNKKPADWIELKNNSADSINLKGFELAVVKLKTDTVNDSEEEVEETWEFPDVSIGAGECLVVFCDKKKKNADDESKEKKDKDKKKGNVVKDLSADFNLPKEGATVQFLSPRGKVLTEVKYGKLDADQSYARENDSTYVATYWQSPGFDNSREGYEKASEKIDKQRNSPLLIWELMSRASASEENWVELKNVSDKEVDLSEYGLSKKNAKEEVWTLPSRKLQPGEIVSVQLAGRTNQGNALVAPFKLGNAETIVLSKGGKFVDGLCAKSTPYGTSIGRAKGRKGFFFYSSPSRGEENGDGGKRFVADKPEFNQKPGVYAQQKNILLKLKDKSRVVHYTLDGSEPNASSPVFKDSIQITKGTVIRAFAEGDSVTLKSPIATSTYLPGVDHKMAVVNISVNKGDLYNYNDGIYVNGPGYTQEWPHKGANYWKKITKKAHVEFFDGTKDGLSLDCGLRIFGGFSRADDKKSFRLKFRGLYGESKVDYDFFGNGQPMELKDIVLRSGSQDYNRCMIRDEFFTSLLKAESPELLTQLYRPVALYINAEYFGLYYLREKIDKHFVARKLNVPSDSINIIMSIGYNEEGSKEPYLKLMDYVSSHDMTNKENYEYMKKNVDFQGLIDYKLGEIFSGNSDVGNIRYVRSTSPESDKKWHFVFYDLDATWVGDKCSPEFYLSAGAAATNANVVKHNIMIARLLQNKEFRRLFLERLSHHMHKTFAPKNSTAVFDKLVASIRPEMKRNCERWSTLSYEQWEKNIKAFRERLNTKPKVMLEALKAHLNVTPEENKKYFSNLGY